MSAANQPTRADAIIIGGGFAGLIAARELHREGHSAIVLEARDRLGGRVWTDRQLGFDLELGGTWVHWMQPYAWMELTRYELDTVPSPEAVKYGWVTKGGEVSWHDLDGFADLFEHGQRAFMEGAREIMPRPFDPFFNGEAMERIEGSTVTDRLAELGLSGDEYDRNYTLWSMNFHSPAENGGLGHAMRWTALGNWDWLQLLEACCTYKVVGGMSNWIERLAADAAADIRLGVEAATVESGGDGIVVRAADGGEYHGEVAIVTVPLNTLKKLNFEPRLPAAIEEGAAVGQASCGQKLWIRVTGRLEPMMALAPPPSPLNFAMTEFWDDETTLVVAFGVEDKLDPEDREGIEAAFRQWIPDAEVEATAGHSWVNDDYSQGTWAMFRPNQAAAVKAAQRRDGRVIIAGSDFALGWGGFIDGAIESGLKAAIAAGKQIGAAS